jgi:hypothetical protein
VEDYISFGLHGGWNFIDTGCIVRWGKGGAIGNCERRDRDKNWYSNFGNLCSLKKVWECIVDISLCQINRDMILIFASRDTRTSVALGGCIVNSLYKDRKRQVCHRSQEIEGISHESLHSPDNAH